MAILQDEVIAYLMPLIEQGGHGAPLPSQNDIRKKLGVSTVTVRKALERLEAQGMIFRHQGKGCFARHAGHASSTRRLFLIIPEKFNLSNEFIFALVSATRESTFSTTFYDYDGNEEKLFHELQRIEPQVVLWLAPTLHIHEKTLLRLLSMPLHIILFNREYDHPSVSCICGDFVQDGRLLGKQLASKGIRHVLYLSLDMRTFYSRLRHQGLEEAIMQAGGTVQVLDASQFPRETDAPWLDSKAFSEEIARTINHGQFDAIVCAQGEIWNTMRLGLSISRHHTDQLWFGTFNSMVKEQCFSPKTITLTQPIEQMARDAIVMATALLDGATPEHRLYISKKS